MRITILALASLVIFSCRNNKTSTAITNMFRGNATHVPVANTKDDCFQDLQWKTYTGAAIRSTPVTDDQNIYTGNENGDFICIDQLTGKTVWTFEAGSPIHSSPAILNDKVFFSDSRQILYALSTVTGKKIWETSLGTNKYYDWKFDFFWSSPCVAENIIYIGSGDGNLYAIDAINGKKIWTFATSAQIRCSPAVHNHNVFVGDMNGEFYSIDCASGKELWHYKTNGTKFVNDSFGYDRKAIISSPVIINNKIIFGSRDGFMYNLDEATGKENWVFDYHITWVLSSVATDGKNVYAGTSDGKYVNAIDINTGKEVWKINTSLVWSSPLLINNKLYVGGYDGYLYCIDKTTGKRLENAVATNGRIQSSPVISNNHLFIGSEDGYLYALNNSKSCTEADTSFIKYVYYDRDAPRLYFRNGTDILLRFNLDHYGYTQIDSKGLTALLQKDIPVDSNVVIVFASNYLPAEVLNGDKNCLLRQFLNKGGRIVIAGLNPVVYNIDTVSKEVSTDFSKLKTVFDIDFVYKDSRTHGGIVYCKATKQGLDAGLPEWWMAPFPVKENQVDIVLGENVNKDASAYVKKYSNKKQSGLIQIWIDSDFAPADINFVNKIATADY